MPRKMSAAEHRVWLVEQEAEGKLLAKRAKRLAKMLDIEESVDPTEALETIDEMLPFGHPDTLKGSK
jgi:hypothetical protein